MNKTKLSLLIDPQEIALKVKEVARKIHQDYVGKDLVIVMVLKGALCFVADLIREIDLPFSVETVQCSSYGERGAQRGELQVIGVERLNIHNRDVLIVDDIFDSGATMVHLLSALQTKNPRSLRTCVLLYKKEPPKITPDRPDYILINIQNQFVVGYGLDFKEQYRGLRGIYTLEIR